MPTKVRSRAELLAALSEILYPGGDLTHEWNGADVCDDVALLLLRESDADAANSCECSERLRCECGTILHAHYPRPVPGDADYRPRT